MWALPSPQPSPKGRGSQQSPPFGRGLRGGKAITDLFSNYAEADYLLIYIIKKSTQPLLPHIIQREKWRFGERFV